MAYEIDENGNLVKYEFEKDDEILPMFLVLERKFGMDAVTEARHKLIFRNGSIPTYNSVELELAIQGGAETGV
jgi:hypothetical protein